MAETSASEHYVADAPPYEFGGRHRAYVSVFPGSFLWRGGALLLGAAFFVTSVGLWAFTAPDASVMLIKLGASIAFLGGAAVMLLMALAPHDFCHLEYDRHAQEFRVLERDEAGRSYVQGVLPVSAVAKMRFEGGALRAWNAQGDIVLSMPMRGVHARLILKTVIAGG